MVHKLAGNAALTAEIVAEIVERTDGVPLFVEELTKAVLESAAQSDQVTAVLGAASLRLRRELASHEHRRESRT
jgi:predicted ATPase